ncbi:MAG: VWA domain-containing protein [Rhizobiaceae bacterium]|nr:MAG: VWA domain-containing protein [Rhizobiaceae bacterium]CAG1014708.1 hypothetical protein RHIZO_04849 [Rhizobiaceae bacterium]
MSRVFSQAILLLVAAVALASIASAQTCNIADRSVALVLDASGSMNARLPNGESRMDVARRAIKGVASILPAEAQVSLWLYGAQSPRAEKDCRDTHLAVAFGPASAGGAAIAQVADGATAQGYTPIAFSLERAADEFLPDAKERVIVLVSDGKETCKGDPVLAAKALAEAEITVHTVGFIVDAAARVQLQAIARATGGSYFDAPVGPELPETLNQALNACKKQVVKLPTKPQPGKLRTTSAIFSLPVFNAESGAQVAKLDRVTREITLPAGIYEVKFGPGSWKGIEILPGETTVIAPGVLRLEHRAGSVKVVDTETGDEYGRFDAVTPELTLMPGVYDLVFGKAEWRFIKVDSGATTTLLPARILLGPGLQWEKARVVTRDGTVVARFDAVTHKAVLPPGDYVVEVDDNKIPFSAAEGDVLELNH